MVKIRPKLNLNEKEFEIEEVFISELGYLMVKLFCPEDKIFVTHNFGIFDSNNNIFLDEIKRIERERNSTTK
jgi:hypothetical protein